MLLSLLLLRPERLLLWNGLVGLSLTMVQLLITVRPPISLTLLNRASTNTGQWPTATEIVQPSIKQPSNFSRSLKPVSLITLSPQVHGHPINSLPTTPRGKSPSPLPWHQEIMFSATRSTPSTVPDQREEPNPILNVSTSRSPDPVPPSQRELSGQSCTPQLTLVS